MNVFCFFYMHRLVIEYIHTAYMYLDLYLPIHICLLRLHMCTLCTFCMYVWRSWNLWLYLHIYHLFGTCRCISAYRDSGDSGSDRNNPRKNWGASATKMGKWCRDQLNILREIDVINGNYPFKPAIQMTACRKNNVLRSRVLHKE